MNPKLSARVLVALSIVYGLTIGLLSILDIAQATMTTFMIVGAVVLGGLWVVRGLFTGRG
ncbi:hypothetical protein FH608_048260 [Nonomuraea phyllanthi]|uniref:Uncharacterized protein n=1 Tax=Nonomuraea phyllanthi TaxID=2219224 RepID=A0A5C4V3F8_9ACTN|nr:hypothetical protein [Nonomuraea phyllanthi]KAB8184765.1 hypothetical protein FH608_048260 [Nonomuraea phyllanthi]QFY09383.1 hypothetical protein GBF35_24490 [Nonomuraea phyllanthi]